MKEKMAKKIMVHWVQRQFLRTVTKLPITGLYLVSRDLKNGRINEPECWPKEGTQDIDRGWCSPPMIGIHIRDRPCANCQRR